MFASRWCYLPAILGEPPIPKGILVFREGVLPVRRLFDEKQILKFCENRQALGERLCYTP